MCILVEPLPHARLLAGEYFTAVPTRRGYSNSQFPFTGSSVMLALRPENNYLVEVMIFGGANEDTVKVVWSITRSCVPKPDLVYQKKSVPYYNQTF